MKKTILTCDNPNHPERVENSTQVLNGPWIEVAAEGEEFARLSIRKEGRDIEIFSSPHHFCSTSCFLEFIRDTLQ